MPFDLRRFAPLRPFVYHITDRANVLRLRRLRCIQPASELLRLDGRLGDLKRRRTKALPILDDDDPAVLKDQRPLIVANAALPPAWSESDLVAFLNEHVYFWPGSKTEPSKHGRRFYECYQGENPAIIRIPTSELFSANQEQTPLFCAYNSGAPRKTGGRASPRGPGLFLPAGEFPRSAGEVVEVAFRGKVSLPATTELSVAPGTWEPL